MLLLEIPAVTFVSWYVLVGSVLPAHRLAVEAGDPFPAYALEDQEGVLLDGLGIRHRRGRNDGVDIAYPTAVLVDADGRALPGDRLGRRGRMDGPSRLRAGASGSSWRGELHQGPGSEG